MSGIPIARIELTNESTTEDIKHLIAEVGKWGYTLEYVNDPADDEPDFYLFHDEQEESE